MTVPGPSAPPSGQWSAGHPQRPSTAGYWLGGLLLAVTGVVAGAWLLFLVVGAVTAETLLPLETPGSTTHSLEVEGTWYVFYHSADGSQPSIYPVVEVFGPDGRPVGYEYEPAAVAIDPTSGLYNAYLRFRVDRKGSHTLVVSEPIVDPTARLAVGHGVGGFDATQFVIVVLTGVTGGATGMAAILYTYFKRRGARRHVEPWNADAPVGPWEPSLTPAGWTRPLDIDPPRRPDGALFEPWPTSPVETGPVRSRPTDAAIASPPATWTRGGPRPAELQNPPRPQPKAGPPPDRQLVGRDGSPIRVRPAGSTRPSNASERRPSGMVHDSYRGGTAAAPDPDRLGSLGPEDPNPPPLTSFRRAPRRDDDPVAPPDYPLP